MRQRVNKINGTKSYLYRYEYSRFEMQDPTLHPITNKKLSFLDPKILLVRITRKQALPLDIPHYRSELQLAARYFRKCIKFPSRWPIDAIRVS